MKLGEFLETYGMTKLAFAYKIGCSEESVRLYLQGREPQQAMAEKIEKFTGGLVPVKELRRKDARDKRDRRKKQTIQSSDGNGGDGDIKNLSPGNRPGDQKRPFTFDEAKQRALSQSPKDIHS